MVAQSMTSQQRLREALTGTGPGNTKEKGTPKADGTLTKTPDTQEAQEWKSRRSPIDSAGASSSYLQDAGLTPDSLYGKFTWKIENFDQVQKRELRSDVFVVGDYKWYILVYPQGCDVCNHLSLFLCVADYDKLLPGWCHFAQFTIAVVNKDPKKSKYSDTLHRFCKKEHDWGWKKFMELSKVLEGFTVANTLVIKAQVQVIRDRSAAPFKCLDAQYRRELVRVYLTNVEGICRRFVEEKREQLLQLKKSMGAFQIFWDSQTSQQRAEHATMKGDEVHKGLVKHFFNEKEVTSTLVMDALYSGCKQVEENGRLHTALKGKRKSASSPMVTINAARNTYTLASDVATLLERAANETIPAFRDDKPADSLAARHAQRVQEMDDYGRDFVERDEKRLTELGRRTVEMYVTAAIVSYLQGCMNEYESIKRQDALILEEELATRQTSDKLAARAAAEKEKKQRKKERRKAREEAEAAKRQQLEVQEAAQAAERAQREEQQRAELERSEAQLAKRRWMAEAQAREQAEAAAAKQEEAWQLVQLEESAAAPRSSSHASEQPSSAARTSSGHASISLCGSALGVQLNGRDSSEPVPGIIGKSAWQGEAPTYSKIVSVGSGGFPPTMRESSSSPIPTGANGPMQHQAHPEAAGSLRTNGPEPQEHCLQTRQSAEESSSDVSSCEDHEEAGTSTTSAAREEQQRLEAQLQQTEGRLQLAELQLAATRADLQRAQASLAGAQQALGERDATLLQRDAALLQRDATVRALEERALAAEAEVRALQASLRAERAAAAHSLGSTGLGSTASVQSAVEGAEGTSSRAGSEASDSLSHAEPLSRASSVEPPQAHHSAGSGSHRLLHWHHLRPPGGGLQEDRLSDGLSQMQSTGSSNGGFSGECSTNPLHNGLLLERIKTAAKGYSSNGSGHGSRGLPAAADLDGPRGSSRSTERGSTVPAPGTPCSTASDAAQAAASGKHRAAMVRAEGGAAGATGRHGSGGLAGGDKQLQQGGLQPVQPASPQASTAGRSSSSTPLAPQARGLNGNAAAFVPAAASPLAAGTSGRQPPPSTSQSVKAGNVLSGTGLQAAAASTGRPVVAANGLSGSGAHALSYRSSTAAGASAAPSEQLPSTSMPLSSTSSAGLPLPAGLNSRPGSGAFLPSTSSPLSSPTQADAARQHVGPFSTGSGQQSKQGFSTPPPSKKPEHLGPEDSPGLDGFAHMGLINDLLDP